MPYWIKTVDRNDLMGPYLEARAESVKDGLDTPAQVFETISSNRVEAKREIRLQEVEEHGIEAGHKNYFYKGAEK